VLFKTIIINEHGQHIEKYFDDFNLRSSKPHERFERYHNLVRYGHRCNFHGMIRANTQDNVACGELSILRLSFDRELVLHGEFYRNS